AQLPTSEWVLRPPGTPEQKRDLVNCATCHVLALPMMSNYTEQQVKDDLIPRMSDMSSQAMPTLIQKRLVRRDANRNFGNLDRLWRDPPPLHISTLPRAQATEQT